MCTMGFCGDGTGAVFLGYATWMQAARTMSDADQDAAMRAACEAAYAGSSVATTDMIISRTIIDLPANNTSGGWLIPACPNCEGAPHAACLEGHARNCVNPGADWPTVVWDGNTNCHSS